LVVCLQSLFAKNLSQRVRHHRFNLKRNSTVPPSADCQSAKTFKVNPVSVAVTDNNHDVDVNAHLEELKREWAKASRNSSHIKILLKHTQQYRRDLLTKHPSGRLQPIIDAFPCFQDSMFVSRSIQFSNIHVV
jgi:hypothetical protein